jgi:hypothetical protein
MLRAVHEALDPPAKEHVAQHLAVGLTESFHGLQAVENGGVGTLDRYFALGDAEGDVGEFRVVARIAAQFAVRLADEVEV